MDDRSFMINRNKSNLTFVFHIMIVRLSQLIVDEYNPFICYCHKLTLCHVLSVCLFCNPYLRTSLCTSPPVRNLVSRSVTSWAFRHLQGVLYFIVPAQCGRNVRLLPIHAYGSLSLSVCLCLSLSVPVCLCPSLSVSVRLCPSLSVSVRLTVIT